MKAFKYLSSEERSEIEILKMKGYSIREIAKVLGRSPNTISYELNRCAHVPYSAKLGKMYARVKVTSRRLQWSKIESNPLLKQYIISRLKLHWNPDEISGRMKKDKEPFYVSKSTIYEWLETVRGERYRKYLYIERPGRRHNKKDGAYGQIMYTTPIESRSLSNLHRTRYGHFETDLIVSGWSGKGGLSTSIERKSRYLHAVKVENQTAQVKQNTLHLLTETCLVRSITFDRGHENSNHYKLGIPTYFCNAYHSWEKGSIENANKMIRRYFPKKTDFSTVSQIEVDYIVSIINNKPRKILNYQTAYEVALAGGVINRVS